MLLKAVSDLKDEDLLKLGKDLANLLTLCVEKIEGDVNIAIIMRRVGRLDNELVLLAM